MLRNRTGGSQMNKRRRFSAEEKYGIIEEARQPGVSIAEVCPRHGISASLYYRWESQMRAGAKEGLANKSRGRKKAADAEIERLRTAAHAPPCATSCHRTAWQPRMSLPPGQKTTTKIGCTPDCAIWNPPSTSEAIPCAA
ncbi:MAG: transposase [Oligosphaeraceae bacterium]|nr:transposase [Oligosphaeraceae bacterium]